MIETIIKRDGRKVAFDMSKVDDAIHKAVKATKGVSVKGTKDAVSEAKKLIYKACCNSTNSEVSVEEVQDIVENALMDVGLNAVAKCYILYRAERNNVREASTTLMKTLRDMTFVDSKDMDLKRENANIDGNTAMGMMLRYGSEAAKAFVDKYVLEPDMVKAHGEGDIHIHDKDFYMLTETCCQIDLDKLLSGGFSTGHGVLREPNGINSYAALAAIAIQANQNDQHGRITA